MSTYYTLGNITLNNPVSAGTYWTGPSGGSNGYTFSSVATSAATAVSVSPSATISLKGEDADIVINGESLSDTLKEIKAALRIPVRINRYPDLENSWDELTQARVHYEKLVEEYKEKQKVFDILKTDN